MKFSSAIFVSIVAVATAQPSIPPNPGYPACSVCGEGKVISLPDVILTIPSIGEVDCFTFQGAGIIGYVDPEQCPLVVLFSGPCNCTEGTVAPFVIPGASSAPVTSVPGTDAPVTSAPVTSAPVAAMTDAPVESTAAPFTDAPVAAGTEGPKMTVAPVMASMAPILPDTMTMAPVTTAPATGTMAPGTMAPGTTAPGTMAPGTTAPVTMAPSSNAIMVNATMAPTLAPTLKPTSGAASRSIVAVVATAVFMGMSVFAN
jgi:hypothetical protein